MSVQANMLRPWLWVQLHPPALCRCLLSSGHPGLRPVSQMYHFLPQVFTRALPSALDDALPRYSDHLACHPFLLLAQRSPSQTAFLDHPLYNNPSLHFLCYIFLYNNYHNDMYLFLWFIADFPTEI